MEVWHYWSWHPEETEFVSNDIVDQDGNQLRVLRQYGWWKEVMISDDLILFVPIQPNLAWWLIRCERSSK